MRRRWAVAFAGAVLVMAAAGCGLSVAGTFEGQAPTPLGDSARFEDAASGSTGSDAPVEVEVDAEPDSRTDDVIDPALTVLWLDASAITGVAADSPLDSWADSSGNGHTATQSTANRRPIYKKNVIGGRPAVRFDGTSTFLVTTPFVLFPTNASGLTLMVVFRAATLSSQRFLFMQPQTNCTNNIELGYRTGNGARPNFGLHAGCSNADTTATDLDTSWHLYTTVVRTTGAAPTNVEFFREGSPVAAQVEANGWPSAGKYGTQSKKVVIGGRDDNDTSQFNSFHDGDIAELVIFGSELDATVRAKAESSLKKKYGL